MNCELSSQSDDLLRKQTYMLSHLLNMGLDGLTNSNVGIHDMSWCVWIGHGGVLDKTARQSLLSC
jgi:hypothetical protein